MLQHHVHIFETLKRLRSDEKGVVSFEYVIVAACVVGAVITAFGTGSTGAIETALSTVLNLITTAVSAVTVAS